MNRGKSSEKDLDRPNNGGHVSRDFPLREIRSRELGSSSDERLRNSMVETLKWIQVVWLKEATCREISHFEKLGIENSGVLVTRDRDVPWWKPWSSRRPTDFGWLPIERLPISGNRGLGIWESRWKEVGLSPWQIPMEERPWSYGKRSYWTRNNPRS